MNASAPPPGPDDLERALAALAANDPASLDHVFSVAYEDLRRVAHERLRQWRPGDTVNTTVLVHEAYLRVRGGEASSPWESRAHFLRYVSRAMRNILIDYARELGAEKRGGGFVRTDFTVSLPGPEQDPLDVVEVDRALRQLGARSSRLEEIVECRFYGGLTVAETAEALGISLRTVERDWTRARTYLHQILAG